MAGLFAAEGVIALEHFFQHVAITHAGFHGLDAHVFQGELQPEVAHHGDHEGVVVELAFTLLGAGEDAHDLIAVDHVAVFVHGETTVGVAVEGHAHHGIGGLDHGLQLLGVGGTGVLVDVVAVRRGVDHDDVRACATQRFGGHHGSGAVGAVGHDLQALERLGLGFVIVQRSDGGHQMIDVQVGGSGLVVAHAAHAGTGRAVPVLAEHGLDVVFLLVGQLEAAACEELDAVVGHRVVGGGNHGTHFDVEHASQVGHARSGDDAGIDHVEAAGRHACGQRGSQEITGNAGITAHQRTAAALGLVVLRTGVTEHTHGGVAQIQRQSCGQIPIGQSSYAIGSKHVRHNEVPLLVSRYPHHRSRCAPPQTPTQRKTATESAPGSISEANHRINRGNTPLNNPQRGKTTNQSKIHPAHSPSAKQNLEPIEDVPH